MSCRCARRDNATSSGTKDASCTQPASAPTRHAAMSPAPPSRNPSASPLQRLYRPPRERAGPRSRHRCPAAGHRPQRACPAQSPAAAAAGAGATCCCGRPLCVDASGEPQGADGQPKQAQLGRELRPGLRSGAPAQPPASSTVPDFLDLFTGVGALPGDFHR